MYPFANGLKVGPRPPTFLRSVGVCSAPRGKAAEVVGGNPVKNLIVRVTIVVVTLAALVAVVGAGVKWK